MRRLFLRLLYSGFGRPFLKVIVGVDFPVLKALREERQFILVANHNSHLDTATLLAAMPSAILHRVHPVAAADHFGKRPWQAKLTRLCVNALLIPRKRDPDDPLNDPINIMLAELDAGGSLILFPEGTRGEPETLQRFKKGVGIVLSQRPGIPYIPVFMDGLGKAMPKGDNLILPHPGRLYFGAPTRVTSTDPDLITEQVERDVLALRPPTEPKDL
jgi:1-acyl-sn-glycerol-3-phosphate acyltransferase